MSAPLLAVTVPGLPQPQGSKRVAMRGGRPILFDDNPKLREWRHRLALGIAAARAGTGATRYDGAVRIHARFLLLKPKSAPKRVTWPITAPDLDKCCRAAGDSLQDAGVIRNDSQIVEWQATKCYAAADEHPGVELIVWAQEETA